MTEDHLTEVAVKVIDQQCSFRDFGSGKPSNRMKAFRHLNIVKLFEVTDTSESLFLIVEHLNEGDIFGYLEDDSCLT